MKLITNQVIANVVWICVFDSSLKVVTCIIESLKVTDELLCICVLCSDKGSKNKEDKKLEMHDAVRMLNYSSVLNPLLYLFMILTSEIRCRHIDYPLTSCSNLMIRCQSDMLQLWLPRSFDSLSYHILNPF